MNDQRPTLLSRAGESVRSRVGPFLVSVGLSVAGYKRAVEQAFTSRRSAGGMQGWVAGRHDPHDPHFHPRRVSLNVLAETDLVEARWRSAWLCQNDPKIRGARHTRVRETIGTGPTLTPNVDLPETIGLNRVAKAKRERQLNQELAKLWEWCAAAVNPGRDQSLLLFLGEQERHGFETGEMLAVFSIAEAFKGYPTMPAIESISTNRLDLVPGMFGALSGRGYGANVPSGHVIRQGIETDALKRRVAYHIRRADMADGWTIGVTDAAEYDRVPAEQVVHGFESEHPGQLRGVPLPIAVTWTARDSRRWLDATITQAELMTLAGLVFKGLSAPKAAAGTQGATDGKGDPITGWSRGQVVYTGANPQADVDFKTPSIPGQQFAPVQELLAREIAAGINMSYATFARDGSKENYSSGRRSMVAEQRDHRVERKLLSDWFISRHYHECAKWGVAVGRVMLTDAELAAFARDPSWLLGHAIVFPGFGAIDRKKEAEGEGKEIENGSNSRPQAALEAGRDPYAMIDEEIRVEVYEREARDAAQLPPKQAAKPAKSGGAVEPDDTEDEPATDRTGETAHA